MIDNLAGVSSKVNFSSFDKHMTLRTDGDKSNCRVTGLKVQSFEAFKKCCIARQNANVRHRHTSNEKKCYECSNCQCGTQILTGKRTKLPDNVKKLKI